jgi:hypothetical protein
MVREDPHKLPAGDHSLDAPSVAALSKMIIALNAGVASSVGVPGPFWQRVAISMAHNNCPNLVMGQKETAPRAREAV